MNVAEVIERLGSCQSEVETRLTDGLGPMVDNAVRRWSLYEREESLHQLLALSQGHDCNYDRPTIGVAYACWYHPQRTVDAIRSLAPLLCRHEGDLDLLDLGSGTGATWWAALLIEEARLALGGAARDVRIAAIESSPPMHSAAVELWNSVVATSSANVAVQPMVSSWLDGPPVVESGIAVMSYVFDHGDKEMSAEIGRAVCRTLDSSGVDHAVLLGSSTKSAIMGAALKGLTETEAWESGSLTLPPGPFTGQVHSLGALRCELIVGTSDDLLTTMGVKSPHWASKWTDARWCRRRAPRQTVLGTDTRTPIVLDDHQARLAGPARRHGREAVRSPLAVLGAAGSGKSQVLVERLLRTVESVRPGEEYTALVSSFNTRMVDQLAKWFIARSPDGFVCSSGAGGAIEVTGGAWRVRFLNWDKVMIRLLGAASVAVRDEIQVFSAVLAMISPQLKAQMDQYEWSTPEFFAEEYRRVVYGLGAYERRVYETVERRGRQVRLGPTQRAFAAEILWHAHKQQSPTWTDLRIDALTRVRQGHQPERLSEVYFDECQDLLPADVYLLRNLVDDPGRMSVWGDPAQALHIGTSHQLPPLGTRWRFERLEGSYRLPIRICEAVAPLAESIAQSRSRSGTTHGAGEEQVDVVLPEAVKSATLGIRPVVLDGTSGMPVDKICDVIATFRPLLDRWSTGNRLPITIAEASAGVAPQLQKAFPNDAVDAESMRAIKGLERPVVIWPTSCLMGASSTAAEWIYTILTRTTTLLVIVLQANTDPRVVEAVQHLRRDRLLFWDRSDEEAFDAHWFASPTVGGL